jgi:hypothetical protein
LEAASAANAVDEARVVAAAAAMAVFFLNIFSLSPLTCGRGLIAFPTKTIIFQHEKNCSWFFLPGKPG